MRLILYALTVFIAIGSVWPSDASEDGARGCEPLLAPSQIEVLKKASTTSSHYMIKVLEAEIAGKPRAVVILGEGAHTKDQQDSNLGKQVLEQFSAYGIESANSAMTWGGAAIGVAGKRSSLVGPE